MGSRRFATDHLCSKGKDNHTGRAQIGSRLFEVGCVCSREQDLVCFCGPNLHVTTFQTEKTSMLDLPYESDIDRVRRKDEIRGRTVMHPITVSSLLAHSDPMAASKKREVG